MRFHNAVFNNVIVYDGCDIITLNRLYMTYVVFIHSDNVENLRIYIDNIGHKSCLRLANILG